MNKANYCQYYYEKDDDGDGSPELSYLSMRCQCSLDGNVGHCPIPGQAMLSEYNEVMT